MKLLLVFMLPVVLITPTFAQSKIDTALRKRIISMFKEDQEWRIEQNKLDNGKPSAFDEATIDKNMGKTDSLNMIAAKIIVGKYGFPGYSLAGEDGSDGFWAIIQHCDNDLNFQQRVLSLMAKEVQRQNATGANFALLQDRVLVARGEKQLYGTQVHLDLKTHHAKPFPIQDSLTVDVRRKAVGLPPLQDYLKLFDKQ